MSNGLLESIVVATVFVVTALLLLYFGRQITDQGEIDYVVQFKTDRVKDVPGFTSLIGNHLVFQSRLMLATAVALIASSLAVGDSVIGMVLFAWFVISKYKTVSF